MNWDGRGWKIESEKGNIFPYIFPYTGHGIYGTLTERLGLLDLLNPYCNSVISVSWTYTDLPEPNKNGEGGLLSDTQWTVVKQHDAIG